MEEDWHRVVEDKVKESLEGHKEDMLKEIGSLFEKISGQSNNKLSSIMIDNQKFKRKSNEEQFKHNAKVMLKLEDAANGLQEKKLEECRANIAEAKELMAHRQKLIKLADSAELGWRVVQEYESNPLASDSDDEKRMLKAEARASKKLKAEKSKKSKTGRNWPYRRPQRVVGLPETQTGGQQQPLGRQGRKPGLCFACGKPGHWRGAPECPERNTNNKISNICNLSNAQGNVSMLHLQYSKAECIEEHTPCCLEEQQEAVLSPVGRLKKCEINGKRLRTAYILLM